MHISILAFGTWGDVRPNVVLGMGLQAAGHDVQIIASPGFGDWINARGLDFYPLRVDVQKLFADVSAAANIIEQIQLVRNHLSHALVSMGLDVLKATHQSDALLMLESGLSVLAGILERNQLIPIIINPTPITPTREFPSGVFPLLPEWFPLRSTFNRVSHFLVRRMQWSLFGARGNELRTEHLNMSRFTWDDFLTTLGTTPILTVVSPKVITPPADWNDHQRVTGYLFDDDPDWTPKQELLNFLDSCEPPVYIGFGSMTEDDPKATTQLIIDVVQQINQRAIILKGWAGFNSDTTPHTVHMLDYAPHSWLFPRMVAVVHHGGAGTTAAGLRAGVPQVVVPFLADQPFWGRRVAELGVGTKPIPRKKLTARNLAAAIAEATSNREMQAKATELGEKIHAEEGLAEAVKWIEYFLAKN